MWYHGHSRSSLCCPVSQTQSIYHRDGEDAVLKSFDFHVERVDEREEDEQTDQRTAWPMKREISIMPEIGGSAIPREVSVEMSQCITCLSHDPLSRPLPSGVNTRHATTWEWPSQLATISSVRTFHIWIPPRLSPDAMYRPSRLNLTDQG